MERGVDGDMQEIKSPWWINFEIRQWKQLTKIRKLPGLLSHTFEILHHNLCPVFKKLTTLPFTIFFSFGADFWKGSRSQPIIDLYYFMCLFKFNLSSLCKLRQKNVLLRKLFKIRTIFLLNAPKNTLYFNNSIFHTVVIIYVRVHHYHNTTHSSRAEILCQMPGKDQHSKNISWRK